MGLPSQPDQCGDEGEIPAFSRFVGPDHPPDQQAQDQIVKCVALRHQGRAPERVPGGRQGADGGRRPVLQGAGFFAARAEQRSARGDQVPRREREGPRRQRRAERGEEGDRESEVDEEQQQGPRLAEEKVQHEARRVQHGGLVDRARLPEDDLSAGTESEPEQPVVHDPALARALDLLKGLAVVRQSHL